MSGRKKLAIDWEAQPLGKIKDEAIALDLGCCAKSVRAARIRLGIPSYATSRTATIDAASDLLGTISDVAIARQLGVETRTVRARREKMGVAAAPREAYAAPRLEIPREAYLDGRTDAEIGTEYGCSARVSLARRNEYGLPCVTRRRGLDWGTVDWTKTNREISEMLGCSPHTVVRNRATFAPPECRSGPPGRASHFFSRGNRPKEHA